MQHRLSRGEALALGAAFLAAPTSAMAQSVTSLKVGGVPEDSITPALWAQQSGLFKKYGLDVDLQSQRSGSAVSSGVVGGAYQIGKSSLPSLIIAHTRNIPFVLVAPGGLYQASSPILALIVRADSTLKSGADLNGKTIAVSALNDLYTISTKEWIDHHGGDSSTIKLIELPISAVPAALEAGRIDAGCCIEPEMGAAVSSGKVKIMAPVGDAIAPEFLYTGWFTTLDYAQKNRAAVDAFARAMREANGYFNAHRSSADDALAKFSGIPAATIAKMRRVTDATTLDPKLIQPLIDAAARAKVIAKGFDAKELIDPGLRAS